MPCAHHASGVPPEHACRPRTTGNTGDAAAPDALPNLNALPLHLRLEVATRALLWAAQYEVSCPFAALLRLLCPADLRS